MSQRSDARRNREAILRAAEEVFAAESVEVPLQRIAEAAGVGRGTLYRNFPDRYALVAAIYEERLARYEKLAAEHEGETDIVATLLRTIAAEQSRVPGLFALIFGDGPGRAYLDPLWRRSIAMLDGPLRAGLSAGTVRPDLTVDDLLMVIGMVYGVLNSPAGQDGPASVERALEIVLAGVRARP